MKTTMTLRTLSVYIALLAAGICEAAETPFFWDDFNREEEVLVTNEATGMWNKGDIDGERIWVSDGQLYVEPLVPETPSEAIVTLASMKSFSVRSSITFPDTSGGNRPFASVFFIDANDETADSDWGGIGSNGDANTGNWPTRNGPGYFDYLSPDDIVGENVHYRLDAHEDTFQVKMWVGDNENDARWLQARRSSELANTFGVSVNPGNHPSEDAILSVDYFAVLPYLDGDFSADNELNAADIDLMSSEIRRDGTNRVFDLDGDAQVSDADHRVLITELFGTWYGDANLDGEFNSNDFVTVFQAGEYEDTIASNSTWSTGDWNGDGDFNSADFVMAFSDGGYEKGPRQMVRQVPEPAQRTFVLVAVLLMLIRRNRKPND